MTDLNKLNNLDKTNGIYIGTSGWCDHLAGPIVLSAVQINPTSPHLNKIVELWECHKRGSCHYDESPQHLAQIQQLLDSDILLRCSVQVINVEEQRNLINPHILIKSRILKAAIEIQLSSKLKLIYTPPKVNLSSEITQLAVNPTPCRAYSQLAHWVAHFARRDLITLLDQRFPQYGLAKHGGRSTHEHQLNILRYSPNPGLHPNPQNFTIGLWIYSLLRRRKFEVLPYVEYLESPPDWWIRYHSSKKRCPLEELKLEQQQALPAMIHSLQQAKILSSTKRPATKTLLNPIIPTQEFEQWLLDNPPD